MYQDVRIELLLLTSEAAEFLGLLDDAIGQRKEGSPARVLLEKVRSQVENEI